MTVRVAINGFGRIGRNVLRAIHESGRTDLEVVAVNDLGPPETNAHLLRFDSVHGRYPGTVSVEGDGLVIDGKRVRVTAIRNPAELPHREMEVDIALECTGIFTSRDKAKAHLEAGAKRVLVSAPADGADLTVVYGVNHQKLTADHTVVSNGSCTTNCLAPVAKVLHDLVGIERGFMTTVHSYTGDQPTLDTLHKDLYRGRAAALSLIPTSTGAAKAIGLVLPELKGKLDGSSIRVPTPNVSLIDLKTVTKRATTKEEINEAMTRAAGQELKGVLAVTDAPNVSIDFNHDPHSSTFHLDQTKVIDGTFVRVLAWYDNEWGFSNRMADTAVAMAKLIWRIAVPTAGREQAGNDMSDTIAPTRADPVLSGGAAPDAGPIGVLPPLRDETRPAPTPAPEASVPAAPRNLSSPTDQLSRLEDKTSRIEEKLARSEAATQRVVDRFETASHRMNEVAQQTDLVAVRSDIKAITRRMRSLPGFGAVILASVITALLTVAIIILIFRYAPNLVR